MKAQRPAQRGSALIEFALVVSMLFAMLAAAWSLGNLMLQEIQLQAAVDQAAQTVATTSALEMLDFSAADDVLDSAEDALVDAINTTGNTIESIDVRCLPVGCTAVAGPARVQVSALVTIPNSVFAYFGYGNTVFVQAEVPYAGRSPAQ